MVDKAKRDRMDKARAEMDAMKAKGPWSPTNPDGYAEEIDLDEEDIAILDSIWDEIGREKAAERELAKKLGKIEPTPTED